MGSRRSDWESEMRRWDPAGFCADGDGLWMRDISGAESLWMAILYTDLREHIPESELDGTPPHEAETCLVDLCAIPIAEQRSALASYGWEEHPPDYWADCACAPARDGSRGITRDCPACLGCGAVVPRRALAEMCIRHGCRAPLDSASGGNVRDVLRAARRSAREYSRDADALAERMARPVNAMGSSAMEYMCGDITSAMSRGLAAGDARARVCAQMYSPIPQDAAVAATIRIADVPSDDPIAYSTGWMDGFMGRELPMPAAELADAYIVGRSAGARVRMHQDPMPGWVR